MTYIPYKQCNKCTQDLPLSEFGKRADSEDGHNWICKRCRSEAAKNKRGRYRTDSPTTKHKLITQSPAPVQIPNEEIIRRVLSFAGYVFNPAGTVFISVSSLFEIYKTNFAAAKVAKFPARDDIKPLQSETAFIQAAKKAYPGLRRVTSAGKGRGWFGFYGPHLDEPDPKPDPKPEPKQNLTTPSWDNA